jgi:hypothetical protein
LGTQKNQLRSWGKIFKISPPPALLIIFGKNLPSGVYDNLLSEQLFEVTLCYYGLFLIKKNVKTAKKMPDSFPRAQNDRSGILDILDPKVGAIFDYECAVFLLY